MVKLTLSSCVSVSRAAVSGAPVPGAPVPGAGGGSFSRRFVAILACTMLPLACGQTAEPPKSSDTPAPDVKAPSSLCEVPSTTSSATVPLDKAQFIATLADYSLAWMTPFHEALLEIDELKSFETWIEGVRGTYEQVCREKSDWEFLPPDDALKSEMKRADYRKAIEDFLGEAVEVESGNRLRLSFQKCTTCNQEIGKTPLFVNATLDDAGLLAISVELTEGVEWTKRIFISEKSVTAVAPLSPLADWGKSANDDLRAGKVFFPKMSGTAYIQARRDDAGHLSASLGLSDLSFTGDPGGNNETHVVSSSPCIGLAVAFAPAEEGSSARFFSGETEVIMSGKSYCPNTSTCSEEERNGTLSYQLGGLDVTLSQSGGASEYDSTVELAMSSESLARINGDTFAHGGLGVDGKGGSVRLGAVREEDAYVIAFEPKLDMAGAMILSKFSEQMRVNWPDTLNDEIFDLTFGGDPVGKIRIPVRELCPEGVYPRPSVPRREVEIVAGSGTLLVGEGRVLEAQQGECVGRNLEDPSTFELTSDYWEAGFACNDAASP